ncbi:Serine/threonine-protein kinase [Dirofilaria immitis]
MSGMSADNDTADTTNESEESDIFWDSLYNEIDSLKRPSEISILEASSDEYKNITDSEQNDDNDNNCDNHDQNLSHCMKSSVSTIDGVDDKENRDIVDETLLPEKLQGKKWIIRNILGEGSFFRVSQAYADGILLAIRRRHFGDYKNLFTTTYRREIEQEYQTCRKHVIDVLSKIGDHDNIATFFGFRRIGFRWEMFIEYVGGGDLLDEIMNYVARSLKLSDFDCAVIFDDNTKLLPHQLGTKAYAPPQRFYTTTKPQCADIWSCGIILYLLLAYKLPWIAAYREDPCYDKWYKYISKKRIDQSNYICPMKFPKGINSIFSELLEYLLDPNEDTRITISDIVDISWLRNKISCKSFVVYENQQSNEFIEKDDNIIKSLQDLKLSEKL